jgi:hypothetical protein
VRRNAKPKVEPSVYDPKQDGIVARTKRLGHAWSMAFSEYGVPVCQFCGERCAADGCHVCQSCQIERGMD